LKQAKRQTRVSARLIAVVEPEGKGKRGTYVFSGFLTDGLALRGSALVLPRAPCPRLIGR
jgi:hypothetical protein